MSVPVSRTPRAKRDLIQHALYIARTSLKKSDQFLAEAERTIANIAAMPELGSPFETDDADLSGIRWRPLRRFKNHLIFYRATETGVEILRVLWGKSDLGALLTEG